MSTRYVLTLCTGLVLGGALITGPANALGKADETTPSNDSLLTSKTKIALFADPRVKGSEINIETTQGTVMIGGKVDTAVAKQAAGEIAKRIDGVKSVKNKLQVVAPSKREATDDDDDPITRRVKDDAITTRVKTQFAKDSDLMRVEIYIETFASVVSLNGQVKDFLTSAQASWTVWQVPGVKSVNNYLTVKE